ncbi:hypothetical protein Tco_1263745 [Tanacetum coccineum]
MKISDSDHQGLKNQFSSLSTFSVFGFGPELEKNLEYTEQVFTRVILEKELSNAPANVVIHVVLAEEAEKITVSYSDVMTAKILDTEKCAQLEEELVQQEENVRPEIALR